MVHVDLSISVPFCLFICYLGASSPARSHPTQGNEQQAAKATTLLYRIVKELAKKSLNARKPVLYLLLRI